MRLIDADALREAVKQKGTASELIWCVAEIDRAPTIEAEPVRHGRWIPLGQIVEELFVNNYICSECDYRVHFRTRYCPDCGKPMDGGVSDEG